MQRKKRKMAYDLIIRNALLKDGDLPVDIGMKGGYIKDIGGIQGEHPVRRILDAENKIVIPGFVNAHTHLDKADLLSEMNPSQFGGTLEENRLLVREFKENYTHSGIKTRAGQVVKEMICQGVTAISTQVDVDPTAKLIPLEAIKELREEFSGSVEIRICAFPQEGVLKEGARELLEKAMTSGADTLGGLPLVEKTEMERKKHIDILFEIAKNHNKDLEVQIDESNDPQDFMLPYLIEQTVKQGYEGRVSATHCISLSKVDDSKALEVIKRLRSAGIHVIITPSCNLITSFPEGKRSRPYNSITRVRELVENGVKIAIGTDNIRDVFYPLGNGSMIREMHVLATSTRMSRIEDVEEIFAMSSVNGARMLGIEYGLAIGRRADMLITNSKTKRGLINSQESIPYVIKNGEVVSTA